MHVDPIFHQDFKVAPLWWEDAPPLAYRNELPSRVDVAIVGSGYCGLAAGFELARNGKQVAVLDSGRIGEGASTRNGGMVSGGLKLPENLRVTLGAERFGRLLQGSVDAYRHIEAFIQKEQLDAQYERCGRLIGAHSLGALRRLDAQTQALANATGFTVHRVPKARMHEEIGSDFYQGGVVVEEGGGLHPARYHQSLCKAFVKAGGSLHEFSGVLSIDRSKGKFTLKTHKGPIDADTVFVATNGYTGKLVPYLQRRIIPITSFVIATEELAPDLVRELNPNGRMQVDTKRILYYTRLSSDHRRIVFGGRASFSDVDESQSALKLHQFMCNVWPQLKSTRITHAWKGNVAFTFDLLPHMGCHEGIYFAGGCQGSGVAMSTYLGHQIALKVLGRNSDPCAFDDFTFPTHPLYRGRPWFLPLIGNYYKVRDRFEQLTGL